MSDQHILSPLVWSIAGSDPTGGAGIQADTRTVHNLGAVSATIITAVTAQNSAGVMEINAVSEEVLLSQFDALEAEQPASVIKIGMLANVQQISTVAQRLNHYKKHWKVPPTVVYDPVAAATSGGDLTEEEVLPAIKEQLLPVVDVLTPNNDELQRLTGVYVFSWDCLEVAAQKAIELGVGAVILKGGHTDIASGWAVDYCHDAYQHFWLASKRIDTSRTHGTGCTFASAVAALLAQHYLLRDAFCIAKAYINQGLCPPEKDSLGKENTMGENIRASNTVQRSVWQGWFPEDPKYFPEVLVPGSPLAQELDWAPLLTCASDGGQADYFDREFPALNQQKLALYPVISDLKLLQQLLELGVSTVQFREKHLQGEALEQAIVLAIKLGKEHQAQLFINDHWQLAIKHGAYGIHLGQEDLTQADLPAIKAAGIRLGISTHGHYELVKARQYRPSYLAIGAIFPTRTKNMTGQIQGINTLQRLTKLNSGLPLVAIGGIDLTNAESVAKTGVDGIAVVTAITEAENTEANVTLLTRIMHKQNHARTRQAADDKPV